MATAVLSGCWFQSGYNGRHSGFNGIETRLTAANVATLTEAWSVTVGPWEVPDPVVSGFGVHAVSHNTLATYRLADGRQNWSVQVLPPPPIEVIQQAESPLVRGDQVLVPASSYRHWGGSGVFAYDARTGAGGEQVAPYSTATLDGDTVVGTEHRILGTDYIVNFLMSSNVDDPTKNWEIAYEAGDVAVTEEWIVHRYGNGVGAFPRAGVTPEVFDRCTYYEAWTSCEPLWTQDLGSATTMPVISDDEQTVYAGDATGRVSALDIDGGSVRWRGSIPGTAAPLVAPPTVGDGSLLVTSSDGRLTAFDADGCGAATCSPMWTTDATGVAVTMQAALAGGVVYVASEDGSIRAFDAAGCGAAVCDPLWQGSTGSPISGAPAVARGHLVVGTRDGRLVAFAPEG